MKKIDYKSLLLAVLIPVTLGAIVGLIGTNAVDYKNLILPPLAPPGWVFGVVWTILYMLMGISSYIIYKSNNNLKKEALEIYKWQLFYNLTWSIIFFNLKLRFISIVWLIILIIITFNMLRIFKKIDKKAMLIQIPYFVWLFFALYLNTMVYLLNG